MSLSSLDSLHLGLSHEQQDLQTSLACFAPVYSTMEPASTGNRATLSFAPEAFNDVTFMNFQRSQVNSIPDPATLSTSEEAGIMGYSRPSDNPSSLQSATEDVSQCFLASDAKLCHLQSLRSQMVYSPYQSQGYYLQAGIQASDHRCYPATATYNYCHLGNNSDSPSPCSTSPTLVHSPILGWHSPEMMNGGSMSPHSPSIPRYDEDDDDSLCDKPYARLIWEALMQAPDHRLMLRDIYEWFQRNTTKPRESGSNGWQNSIRHNLSMNQAFENDKSDHSDRGGPTRKSNSVWILTDSAVKNGVQSTTRYRKTGGAKKSALNRTPAVQRQRSGAKGGLAARRSAKLRAVEQKRRRERLSPSQAPSNLSTYGYNDAYSGAMGSDYLSTYNPATPPDDRLFAVSNVLPLTPYSMELPAFKAEGGYGDDNDLSMHDLGMHALADASIEDLLRLHQESS